MLLTVSEIDMNLFHACETSAPRFLHNWVSNSLLDSYIVTSHKRCFMSKAQEFKEAAVKKLLIMDTTLQKSLSDWVFVPKRYITDEASYQINLNPLNHPMKK